MALDVEPPKDLVRASGQDVTGSILVCVAYGASGGCRGMWTVSVWSFPSVSKFFIPEATPSGFEDMEFGFV